MKYEELIKWCKKTIKLYNPVIDTIDTHSERFLKKVLFPISSFSNINIRSKMTMKGFLFDRSFTDSSATMNSSKHLTKYYSRSTLARQTEMTALSTGSSSIFFVLDFKSYP